MSRDEDRIDPGADPVATPDPVTFNTLEFDDTTFDDFSSGDQPAGDRPAGGPAHAAQDDEHDVDEYDGHDTADEAATHSDGPLTHQSSFEDPASEVDSTADETPQPDVRRANEARHSRATRDEARVDNAGRDNAERDNDVRRHQARRGRRMRVLAYAAGLIALIGGFTAVKANHHDTPDPVTASRDDDRASRDEIRATADTATPTTQAALGTAPTPSTPAETTPPAPTTTPPAPPKPKPTVKATVKKAVVAPPPAAGCSSYSGNQLIACDLLPSFGFSTGEMAALVPMWNNESGWNASAENPGSGAYGIPQALPGSKMASAGSDWQTNPATQIKWGLDYIKSRYGTPTAAWAFWQANGWY